MFCKGFLALVAVAGLAAVTWPASVQAMPGSPSALLATSSNVEQASFWGLPYPYGYEWRRPPECEQLVRERDARGRVHWRRVWVCD